MNSLNLFPLKGLKPIVGSPSKARYRKVHKGTTFSYYSPNVDFTVLKNESANSVTPRLNKMKSAEIKMSLESYSLTAVASLNGLNLYIKTKPIITYVILLIARI